MAVLSDILLNVHLTAASGDMGREISGLHLDSRQVKANGLFVAIPGTQTDGHRFIGKAIANGATAIVCEQLPEQLAEGVSYVTVAGSAEALGVMSANYYGHPTKGMKLIAITGTNGKTTVATLLFQLFRKLGYSCGLLSTVVNRVNDELVPATHTTPDSLALNQLLLQMKEAGCTHVFMEASSHGIAQGRMAGLAIRGAVFMNITHDHLDYHGNFDNYIKAKKKLFDDLPPNAFALFNGDDKRGKIMVQNTKASKHTFGLRTVAEFKGKVLSNGLQGLELELDNHQVWFQLIGEFNAYNLLAAYAVARCLDEPADEVLTQLSGVQPAPGRFQQAIPGHPVIAIVDYAHTPDALKNVLATIKGFRTGNEQVITVVGAGGNRDKAKRPVMAQIACELSDKVILTSDNPRDEEPQAIIEDMNQGVSPSNYRKVLRITDRREAIRTACHLAQAKDIVLIAGKGHETYQEVKGERHHFDDLEEVRQCLRDQEID